METISLKKASLKDLEIIADIEKNASSKTYAAIIGKEELEKFLQNDQVFLIKNEESIIGLASFETNQNTAHCTGLAIYPEFREKGFGNKAMRLLLKKMEKYQRVELVVHPHNNSAIKLYLSLGFIIESWENNYFGNGEPRLVMIKK